MQNYIIATDKYICMRHNLSDDSHTMIMEIIINYFKVFLVAITSLRGPDPQTIAFASRRLLPYQCGPKLQELMLLNVLKHSC